MTTTHTNIAIVDGEVCILSDNRLKIGDYYYDKLAKKLEYCDHDMLTIFDEMYPILASTAKLDGIPQLDRKHFVKPKVDVEELALKYSEQDDIYSFENDNLIQEIFKVGYNSKEAEFTEQDLIDAMYSAKEYPNKRTPEATFSDFVKAYMNKLRPLSLPASINTDENLNVIKVEWE